MCVPSRYWSPLGVPQHFVGGWERLYKAFHGSWYIAVAFTSCRLIPRQPRQRDVFPFLENVPENISIFNKSNPTLSSTFSSSAPPPSPTLQPFLVLHSRSAKWSTRSSNFLPSSNFPRFEPKNIYIYNTYFFFLSFFFLASIVTRNDEGIVIKKDK